MDRSRSSRDDKNIDLELHELGDEAWHPVGFPLSAAKLDLEVFSLDITEIAQPLPQRLDVRPRIGSIAGS